MKNIPDNKGSSAVIVKAPFSKEEVKNLKRFQKNPEVHPFTCPTTSCDFAKKLIPTTEGMKCPCGKYQQDWVYRSMINYPKKYLICLQSPFILGLKVRLHIATISQGFRKGIPLFSFEIYPLLKLEFITNKK